MPAFTLDRVPNTLLLGLLVPDLWSLPAQRRLFQQALKFSEVRILDPA
jgi:hypothetical protein